MTFATIWRADSPLARCANCGAQQQFHGRPNFSCVDFRAETVDDIDPEDLSVVDAFRALIKAHDQRAVSLRNHIVVEIEKLSGLSADELREVLS